MSARVERLRYPDQLVVRGRIEGAGFLPGWWVTPSREMLEAWRVPDATSGWTARAVDRDGRVLAEAVATVAVAVICGGDATQIDLSALLSLPPGTSAVVVAEGSREVYRRDVPARATLSFAGPLPRRLARGAVRTTLRIEGPAPADGAYVVLRWEAPDQPACPLALAPAAAEVPVEVDLTDVPGGPGGRLVALYHDGIHATLLASDALELPPRPARPTLILPSAGMRLGSGGSVPLEASLDGDGDPADLLWRVDGADAVRGPQGVLQGLASGRHRVSLAYRDQQELGVEIEVVDPAPARPTPAPIPPWRSLPVTWHGAPLPGYRPGPPPAHPGAGS